MEEDYEGSERRVALAEAATGSTAPPASTAEVPPAAGATPEGASEAPSRERAAAR